MLSVLLLLVVRDLGSVLDEVLKFFLMYRLGYSLRDKMCTQKVEVTQKRFTCVDHLDRQETTCCVYLWKRVIMFNVADLPESMFVVLTAAVVVWDYELQVSLSEALCRLTPRKEREQRASQWFPSRDISNAFCDIRDGDFEVVSDPPVCLLPCLYVWTPFCLTCLSLQDCRRFLNFINSYHGDQRRWSTLSNMILMNLYNSLLRLFLPVLCLSGSTPSPVSGPFWTRLR